MNQEDNTLLARYKKAFRKLTQFQKKQFQEQYNGNNFGTLDSIIGRGWRNENTTHVNGINQNYDDLD